MAGVDVEECSHGAWIGQPKLVDEGFISSIRDERSDHIIADNVT